MNIQQPWNIFFFVCLIVYFGIRHVFIGRTKGETKTVSLFGRQEKILLFLMVPAVLLLPLAYLFTSLLAFANYQLPAIVQWIGGVTLLASLWLFWRSHTDLGKNWSVSLEVRDGHELITHGVYRFIRHPMYASIWLWAIAQGLLLENWLAGWAVVPIFTAMYVLRIPKEEGLMRQQFGEQYDAYTQRTGRLLPRVVGRKNV